jgi:curved DNA-binding protein CbpA
VHLGDDTEIASDDDLFRRMHEELEAQQARASESAAQAPPRGRRKSKAQQAREAEVQQATQSLREIFRKLASALHPDRETDPEQRSAKTALMQRVNQAYAANDLLTLLELQLQIEEVDAGHIANASAQRLRHYNKVLADQLQELRAEAEREEARFRMDYGFGPGWGMNPAKLGATIGQTARELRGELAMLEGDLRTFADRGATRRWLKRERQTRRDAAFGDEFF